MARHGYDLALTSDPQGWRAAFLHRDHVTQPWVGQVLWRAAQPALEPLKRPDGQTWR